MKVVLLMFLISSFGKASYDCGEPAKGKKSVEDVNGREVVYECQPGYKEVSGDRKRTCLANNTWSGNPLICEDDINCLENNAPCQNGGRCIDTDPSLYCDCSGSNYYGALCEEANGGWSSWSSTHNCSSTCDAGIIVHRRRCDNPKPTPKGLMCKGNAIETMECFPKACHEGMYKWCNSTSDICQQNSNKAFCSVRHNKYKCTCLAGVEQVDDQKGNFVRCEDVDECIAGTHTCDRQNGLCINTDGSFKCSCNPGFKGDGKVCADLDECSLGTHLCDINAKCYNRPGGFNCVCKDGYRSIHANRSAYVGHCKESRLLRYGYAAGDDKVDEVSRGTGERVTALIPIPPGLPLGKKNEAFSCETLYATENGVVVVTRLPPSADSDRKPTFRNPVNLKNPNNDNVIGGKFHKYICSIIAPFWADASFGKDSEMWSHSYDDITWPGNKMKQGKLSKKELKKQHAFQKINKILPEKFIPNFVAVFTWVKMLPPWPTKEGEEEVTYQVSIATDGTETHIVTLYEDGAMTWRPVYDVPSDIPRYPATAGYIVFGSKVNETKQYSFSGVFNEENPQTTSVYRADIIPFNSTSYIGIDSYNLTLNPTMGSKSSCYKWYLETKEGFGLYVTSGVQKCPPSLSHLNLVRNVLWKETLVEDKRLCFVWLFHVSQDGEIECCYRKNTVYEDSPLISGITAWNQGAGFYKVKGERNDKKKLCCGDTKNEFFCKLYTRRRPASTSEKYIIPKTAFGEENGAHVNFGGKTTKVTGSGQYQLMRIRSPDNENLDLIANYESGMLMGLAMRYANYTFEIHKKGKEINKGMQCTLNSIICQRLNNNDKDLLFSTKSTALGLTSVTLATRLGLFFNVSNGDNGLRYSFFIPSFMAKNTSFLSGLLTENGKCHKSAKGKPFKKILTIPCDLHSVAESFNTTIAREAFFTKEIKQYNKKDSQINKINSADPKLLELAQIKQAVEKPFPPHIGPVVEARNSGSDNYDIQMNISQFNGDIMFNQKRLERSSDSLYKTKIAKSELESTGEISFTNSEGKTTLVYRKIVICDCNEKQGKCQFSTESGDDSVRIENEKAGCVCDKGFVGERCDEIENPCSELPCFSRVKCEERKTNEELSEKIHGVIIEKRYFCGKCPPTLKMGNGESCFHENPCLLPPEDPKTHKCENSECINKPNGYTCECLNGFRESDEPHICEDVDECNESNHDCDKNVGVCVNTPGSYICNCVEGYKTEIESTKCVDVDECLDDNGGCERRCHNSIGSYKCSCELGYRIKPDGKSCQEIFECDEHAEDVCDQICVDSEKGQPFVCACHERYTLLEDYRTCRPDFTTIAATTVEEITTTGFLTTTDESTTAYEETTHPTTSIILTTGIEDLLPPGWDFIDPNADAFTKLFQTLRKYLYLQALQIPEFRKSSEFSKEKVSDFIELLSRIIADSQSGRAIAYLLAVKLQNPHDEWKEERDCPIMFEQLFQHLKNPAHISALDALRIKSDWIDVILKTFGGNNFPAKLVIDFNIVTHLIKLSTGKNTGRTGIDANSNFKDILNTKGVPEIVTQIKNIQPCQIYLIRMSKTTEKTTTKSTTIQSLATTRPTTTSNDTTTLGIVIYKPSIWLIIGIAGTAVTSFCVVVCVTRFCLTWKRQRRYRQQKEEQKRLKKREKMKSWPRYVDTSQSHFDAHISRKLNIKR